MTKKLYTMNSDLQKVPSMVREIMEDLNKQTGCMSDDCNFKIKVVLNEVIVNAVIHGNVGNKDKEVAIEMEITDNGIRFDIKDEGLNFEEKDFSKCDLISENNRGIMICRNLCDRIEHCYIEGKGSTVSVIFINKDLTR